MALVSRTGRNGGSRQAILDAAAELIRTKGVVGTSISDIVHASGTSAGAIYHWFASKQEIVLAVGQRAVGEPVALATASTGPVSPGRLFRLAAQRVVEEGPTSALLVQVWAGAAADPLLRDLLLSHGEGFHAGVARHIEDWCQTRGLDPVVTAQTVVGAVIGMAVQDNVFPAFDRDAYVAQVADLLDRVA